MSATSHFLAAFTSISLEDILYCRSKLAVQLMILVVMTAAMFPSLKYITWEIALPLMNKLSPATRQRFSYFSQLSFKNTFQINLTLEEAYLVGCVMWGILCAHLVGGLLCVPSVFRLSGFTSELASALARHGALSEAAWELSDIIKRGYQIFVMKNEDAHRSPEALAYTQTSMRGGAAFMLARSLNVLHGKRKFKSAVDAVIAANRLSKLSGMTWSSTPDANATSPSSSQQPQQTSQSEPMAEPAINPLPLLIILGIHHSLGQLMIIPMNLYYPNNVYYHELVFLLLAAAFLCLGIAQVSYMIDISTTGGLALMTFTTFLSWSAIVYSRVLRFGYVAYMLLKTGWDDHNYVMFGAGSVGISLMGLINVLFFMDGTGKLVKFGGKLIKALASGGVAKGDDEYNGGMRSADEEPMDTLKNDEKGGEGKLKRQ